MTTPATTDQLGYIFTYPFQDPDWKRKLGIGFLLVIAGFIVPLIPWLFLYGYLARLIRMVLENDGQPALPEWDEWGELLLDGLRLTAVYLVTLLPFFLVFGCGYLAILLPAFTGAAAGSEEADLALALTSLGGSFLGIFVISLSILLMFLVSFILPPLMAHVSVEERLGAAFEVGTWWGILRANLGGFLVAYILLFGTGFLLLYGVQILYATLILCCLIPVVFGLVAIYGSAVAGALIGQSYMVGKDRLAA